MPPAARPETILLIDDENHLRGITARLLELEGYAVRQAPNAYRGLALLSEHTDDISLILCDVKLPDAHGVELLPRLRAQAPLAEIVLLTAYGTVPDSVRAIEAGAFDYLTKGDSDDQLLVVVDHALTKARLQRRVAELEKIASPPSPQERGLGGEVNARANLAFCTKP